MCGTCVADQSVTSPPGSGRATTPRGSIAFGISGGWTYVCFTITSAPSSKVPVSSFQT